MNACISMWARLLFLVFLLAPSTAHAHVPITGMGGFYNGLLHPLMNPAHILILLGLALWLGQHSLSNLKIAFSVFTPLLTVALAVTLTGLVEEVNPPILLSIAMCTGILVAAEKSASRLLCGLLFGISALAVGIDSAVMGKKLWTNIQVLLGTWISAHLILFDVAYFASLIKQEWQKIGIRVLGSWIVAIALIVLVFELKKG